MEIWGVVTTNNAPSTGLVEKATKMDLGGSLGVGSFVLAGIAGLGGVLFVAMERNLKLGRAAEGNPFGLAGRKFKGPYVIAALTILLIR